MPFGVGPQLRRKATARAHSVHVRAARLAGEQVPTDALPVGVRASQPRIIAQPDGDAGEDLVPEPAHEVEEAEPGTRHQLADRPIADAFGRDVFLRT